MTSLRHCAWIALAALAGVVGVASSAGAAVPPARAQRFAVEGVRPQVRFVRFVTETVTSGAPAGERGAREAASVSPGTSPRISCNQYLTYDLYAAYDLAGTSTVLTSLSSVDYTKWCSGKVYTESYHIYCDNFVDVLVNFTCVKSSSGVIGQGSKEVNPWYNESVILSVLEPDGYDVTPGESYCRNYMTSTGGYSDWCTISWS